MTRCHECDSQVAENDVFCPFCGARLLGVSAEPESASEPVDDSLARATTERDMADIDLPEMPDDLSRTSDNIPPQSTAEFSTDSMPIPNSARDPVGDLEPAPEFVPPPSPERASHALPCWGIVRTDLS